MKLLKKLLLFFWMHCRCSLQSYNKRSEEIDGDVEPIKLIKSLTAEMKTFVVRATNVKAFSPTISCLG